MDLSATMAALDNALRRAEQVAGMLTFGGARNSPDAPMSAVPDEEPAPVPPYASLAESLPVTVPPPTPDPPVSPPV
jgi:hypothetical protein